LPLVENGAACCNSVRRTTASRPFAFLALNVNVHRRLALVAGKVASNLPVHFTCAGRRLVESAGLADNEQRDA